MKTIIKIVSIVTLCLASSAAGAQTDTKVIGDMKEEGAKVSRSASSSQKKHSVVGGNTLLLINKENLEKMVNSKFEVLKKKPSFT